MNKQKKLPIAIKIPVFLAAFLTIVLVFVTFFENLPESAGTPQQCQLKFTGTMKLGDENLGLVTHLYKDEDGKYVVAGLNRSKDAWLLGKMGFGADFHPYWEVTQRRASSLKNSGSKDFKLSASADDWAFVRDEHHRQIAVHILANTIHEKSSLGLCTNQWDDEARIRRVNKNNIVVWNSQGQIGFYDLRRLTDYVPKGVSRSPDLVMVVDPNSSLGVGQCDHLAKNRQAHIDVDNGFLAFSSGMTGALNLYAVEQNEIKLNPLQLPQLKEGWADFTVSKENVFGVKTSDWLDRTETWKLYRLPDLLSGRSDSKSVLTAKPLQFRGNYVLDARGKANDYWLTEQYKSHFFFDSFLVSYVNAEGVKQSFEVDDAIVKKAVLQNALWIVLPEGRHLFAANVGDEAKYSVVECHPTTDKSK